MARAGASELIPWSFLNHSIIETLSSLESFMEP